MNKKIVFATNNEHKLRELREIVGDQFKIVSLKEIGCHEEIIEDADTLEGNALIKAEFVYNKYHLNCFADDTGLEVEALDNAPGIYTARYAGEACSNEDNMAKLLQELEGELNRKAQFRTVIALIYNGKKTFFNGVVNGKILDEKRGVQGFGYDPIFTPNGYDKAFAELGDEIKNKISHRAKATQQLISHLREL